MAERILCETIDVDNQLKALGVDRNGLVKAVRFAEHDRSFVTANDPVGFANYVVYAKLARSLRETYLLKGWIKDDSYNQAAIKNQKKKIRIVPCNFDEFAGNRLVTPTNRSPKGEVSRRKSACNRTAWLPGLAPIAPELNDGYQTWILGVSIDDEHSTGAELSFPVAFDGNFFTQFGTRIIILTGEEEQGARVARPVASDAVGIVEIDVKRK